MTFEDSILTALNLYFNVVRISSQLDVGVDGILSLKGNSNIRAYVCIQRNLNGNTLSHIIHSTNRLVSQDKLSKIPMIIFKQVADNTMFGILSYWDFERCFYNENIKWRELNELNLDWLKVFLSAQRGNIRFLPNHMFRVEKIISLNSSSLLEGEIRYLRKFQGDYRMRKTKMQSNTDKFNKLLYGIPEDEFPTDALDNYIFSHVKKVYPAAEVKSNLILFETDLLDVARLKDKQIKHEIIYARNMQTDYLIGTATLEILYNQSFWTTLESVRKVLIAIDCRNENEIQQLRMWIDKVYEPLSEINI